MDPRSILPFDPSDRFEDVVSLPNNIPDDIQHLQDWDTLMVLWTMQHENVVPNPHIDLPDDRFPPVLSRYQGEFEANYTDDRAWSVMMEQIDQVNQEADNLVDDEELFNSISNELFENPDFPCANQYQNSNSGYDMAPRSPQENLVQPSRSCNTVGIQYQTVAQPQFTSAPICHLGCTELAPYAPPVQLPSTTNQQPPSIKKSLKKQSYVPSAPKLSNMIEWYIRDESGRRRRPFLHEFLRILLNNETYSGIAKYIDRNQGIFKFYEKEKAAELWGVIKGRNGSSKMTYEKLARGIRFYYSNEIIRPTPGRFTFRFGSASGFGSNWMPA